MVMVIVKNGDFDSALREFRRKVKYAGILNDLRKYECYQKPSVKKRLKRKRASAQRYLDSKPSGRAGPSYL